MKRHPLSRSAIASLWAIFLSGFLFHVAAAGELRFAGALGNSTESAAAFAGKTAAGMGPVIDDESAIWERGGSTRLNRYALDGRLLASFDLPDSQNRDDQLTRV